MIIHWHRQVAVCLTAKLSNKLLMKIVGLGTYIYTLGRCFDRLTFLMVALMSMTAQSSSYKLRTSTNTFTIISSVWV